MDISVLPKDFIERLPIILPKTKLEQVKNSFCRKLPTTFRTNTLKITTSELTKKLDEMTISYEPVGFIPDAFVLKGEGSVLTRSGLFDSGLIYVQSISSMIPALVLDPQKNESVLDLTAAPGSKTSQIAALMKNSGEIVANDISRIRLFKLRANMAMLGVSNVRIIQRPGQSLWKKYPNFFDKTLVDVPCSLEGRFVCDNPKSYSGWSIKKVKKLSQLQKFLLRSAVSATKPGGTIVYSTCTLSPEENELVIDWILKKEEGSVELENISFNIPDASYGLTKWNGKNLSSELSKSVRIFPSEIMEGFFIAKLRKNVV